MGLHTCFFLGNAFRNCALTFFTTFTLEPSGLACSPAFLSLKPMIDKKGWCCPESNLREEVECYEDNWQAETWSPVWSKVLYESWADAINLFSFLRGTFVLLKLSTSGMIKKKNVEWRTGIYSMHQWHRSVLTCSKWRHTWSPGKYIYDIQKQHTQTKSEVHSPCFHVLSCRRKKEQSQDSLQPHHTPERFPVLNSLKRGELYRPLKITSLMSREMIYIFIYKNCRDDAKQSIHCKELSKEKRLKSKYYVCRRKQQDPPSSYTLITDAQRHSNYFTHYCVQCHWLILWHEPVSETGRWSDWDMLDGTFLSWERLCCYLVDWEWSRIVFSWFTFSYPAFSNL